MNDIFWILVESVAEKELAELALLYGLRSLKLLHFRHAKA